MCAFPLCGHIPRLTYFRHFVHREQFFQYESIQDEWLIFAVENGSLYFEIDDHHATASFGDLVFCPPGVVFRRVVISPITLFVFRMSWRDDEGNEIDLAELGTLPVGKVSLRNTERLIGDYAALKPYSTQGERWSMVLRSHYLHHIWLLYCEEAEELLNEEPHRPADSIIQQATRLIQVQAFERFSLNAIAASLGISRMQLCKKFHAELGTTPIKYLTSLRLEKAKTLLTETNLTLDQISECCGYQNGFYLSRVFKNNCLVTPMQYRKAHRL
ncbi:helix-turn-helix transcriptional regulator [Paenibacillus germinis]|nr:AraC family transcriptional regulator [Paenibacillus germinis]